MLATKRSAANQPVDRAGLLLDTMVVTAESLVLRLLDTDPSPFSAGQPAAFEDPGEPVLVVEGVEVVPLMQVVEVPKRRAYVVSLSLSMPKPPATAEVYSHEGVSYIKVGYSHYFVNPLDLNGAMLIAANGMADALSQVDPVLPAVMARSEEVVDEFANRVMSRPLPRDTVLVRTCVQATSMGVTVGAVHYDLWVDRWAYYRVGNVYVPTHGGIGAAVELAGVRRDHFERVLEEAYEFVTKRFPHLLMLSYIAVNVRHRLAAEQEL